MSEPMAFNGQCLCGAVTVQAAARDPILRVCHCEMCRQQNSFAFANIQTDQESIVINGPVKMFKSSDWAQRAFCDTCGSTLWYGAQHDGSRNLAAGLFANAGKVPLAREYFVDVCMIGNGFAGDHEKLTRQQTFALFAPDEGDAE